MALNVKSIFYSKLTLQAELFQNANNKSATVGLHSLLLKGTTPDSPSRVINIASMAGIMTSDVTTTGDGGLSAPGHGTFSCTSLIRS
jgi:hypothetical protein